MTIGDCDASFDTHSFWVGSRLKNAGRTEHMLGRIGERGVILYVNGNELAGALSWMPLPHQHVSQQSMNTSNSKNIHDNGKKHESAHDNKEQNVFHQHFTKPEFNSMISDVEGFRHFALQTRQYLRHLEFDVSMPSLTPPPYKS